LSRMGFLLTPSESAAIQSSQGALRSAENAGIRGVNASRFTASRGNYGAPFEYTFCVGIRQEGLRGDGKESVKFVPCVLLDVIGEGGVIQAPCAGRKGVRTIREKERKRRGEKMSAYLSGTSGACPDVKSEGRGN